MEEKCVFSFREDDFFFQPNLIRLWNFVNSVLLIILIPWGQAEQIHPCWIRLRNGCVFRLTWLCLWFFHVNDVLGVCKHAIICFCEVFAESLLRLKRPCCDRHWVIKYFYKNFDCTIYVMHNLLSISFCLPYASLRMPYPILDRFAVGQLVSETSFS